MWVNGQEVATQGTVQGRPHAVHVRHHQPADRRGVNSLGARGLIRTTRTPCSRSTTSTGPRSHRTTTPASSSRSSCTLRGPARADQRTRRAGRRIRPVDGPALTLKADITNHAGTPQTGRLSATVRRQPATRSGSADRSPSPPARRRRFPSLRATTHSSLSTIRASGGPPGWAGNRSTACTPR